MTVPHQPPNSIDARDYPAWRAPEEDGALLLWPVGARLVEQTLSNHRSLNSTEHARLLSVPLSEVRNQSRRWLGHAEADRPMVITGHQCELWHPGVWVKNAVIDAVAQRSGGLAYHIAVDTDSPKHLHVRWAGGAAPITDDPRLTSAAWSGLLHAPTPAHLTLVRGLAAGAMRQWGFEALLPDVFNHLSRLSIEQPRLTEALTSALHALDWSLGLRHHAMMVSPLLSAPPYLLFVAHVIAGARRFASHYNLALESYRREHGIDAPGRPMPNLFLSPTAVELPFWLDDLAAGTRSRPSAFDRGDGVFVLKLVNGEEIAFDDREDGWSAAGRLGRFLAGTAHRLAPRALMLTMYLRLFAADQFVHGIGGGRYDQVLDRLVIDHFGMEPPRFAVATATLRFPSSQSRSRVCAACVEQEGHRLQHAVLGERKREMVAEIARLPRRSGERRRAFSVMRTALREAWSASTDRQAWQARLDAARAAERRDAVEFDRELFYPMQPRERLVGLIERVRAVI